jgi:hypothetical protein
LRHYGKQHVAAAGSVKTQHHHHKGGEVELSPGKNALAFAVFEPRHGAGLAVGAYVGKKCRELIGCVFHDRQTTEVLPVPKVLFSVLPPLLFLCGPALGEPDPSSDREIVLSERLVREINEGLACRVDVVALRRQIDTLTAELDKLRPTPLPIPRPGQEK